MGHKTTFIHSFGLANKELCYFQLWKHLENKTKDCSQHFPKQAVVFTCLQYKCFENTVDKGAISPFFLFDNFLPFSSTLKLFCANLFSLEV